VGYLIKGVSDRKHAELSPQNIYQIFEDTYINQKEIFSIPECHFKQQDGILAEVTIEQNGEKRVIETSGNGRLDAVSNAIKMYFGVSYELAVYEEHAISQGSSSKAAAYVEIICQGSHFWGVGIDEDIIKSSIAALASAANKMAQSQKITEGREERIVEIMNFIQTHYADVTLDMLAESFRLSKAYLSRYIKEKSGLTFQEAVKKARMKKARTMLKETNQTVESIAAAVGYDSVEHFNRLFKKAYDMTPVQFRRQYQ
jgi:2-isopropylmalate synthase